MPFPDELEKARGANFCHVGVHDLNSFLNSEPAKAVSSDLLQQYRAHISELAEEQKEAKRDWHMDYGPIQRRFAEKLKVEVETKRANDSWATRDREKRDVIWNARNRGGGHWTQYRFLGWHLFWRMDTGGNLRMMVDKRQPHPGELNVRQYRAAFKRACPTPAGFKARSGNEMTVGAIEYPYPKERKIGPDVDTFLTSIAQVHERFLQELARIRADNAAS